MDESTRHVDTHPDLERLAEACEEAADYCREVAVENEKWRGRRDWLIDDPNACAVKMDTLARAIRAGRVTVTEETNG